MNKKSGVMSGWARQLSLCLFFVLSFVCSSVYSEVLNMPVGYTEVSHSEYAIHQLAFWVSVGICVFVFAWMAFNFIKFRKSKGAKAKQIHGHAGVEVLWTVIPAILLIIMAIPATKGLILIHDTDNPAMSVEVIGYQWKWRYKYLDHGIDFFSNSSTTQDQIQGKAPKSKWFLLEVDKPMIVPVGQKVRLLITSNDVIHNWWVPDLGVKQDAIPGYINENWMKIEKAGTYRGECAELCGVYHGFMPIVVKAVPQAQFEQWVQSQQKVGETSLTTGPKAKPKTMTKAALLKKGKTVYSTHCAACHQANGKGLPPTFPALIASPIATGSLDAHIGIVLNGKAGTTMQAFKDQLNPEELASVITYEREAWGNGEVNATKNNPVVVQPAEIIKHLQ